MRSRSNTWINLATRGEFEMEAVAVINGTEYAGITAPVIDRSLFSSGTLSVGNCVSASVDFTVMTTDTIPKSAQVIIKGRITDGTTNSEWKNFGTFWINKRTTDDDLITLECYDAMMKANQNYVDDTNPNDRLGWPKSMQTCVSEIAQRIGVQIDSRTTIKTTAPYVVPYPAKLTMMQVLGYIGGCHGGNWIITPDNKLRLVPLVSPPADSFDIIDYDYNPIETEDGYKLVWQHIQTQEVVQQRAGGGLIHVPVVIGSITTARQYTISRVTMTVDTELGYTAGDSTGYELQINDNPYSCQAICDDLLSELSGISYAPFNISGACYDPMAELGDWIIVGDKVRGVLCAETATFDINYRVEASAPGEDELNSEYPYLTEIQKLHNEDERLQKYTDAAKVEIRSTIEQTRTSILLEVSETYATKTSQTTAINIVNGQITAEVTRATGAESELSGRITVNANNIALKVSQDSVIASINASIEQDGSSAVKINANKVDLSGYVTITGLGTAGQTTINGSNITTGIIKDAGNNTSFNLSTGALTMKSGSINLGSGNFTVDNSGNVAIKYGTINIGSDNFKVDSSGNVTIKSGTINIGSNNFIVDSSGNVTIKSGSINLGSGKFTVDNNGNVAVTKGSINLGSGAFTVDNNGNVSVTKGAIDIGNGVFKVTSAGAVTLTSGSINIGNGNFVVSSTGTVTLKYGSIDLGSGNFNVSSTGVVTIKSGSINLGSGNFIASSTGSVTIKSGSINLGSGNFVVTTAGKMTCLDASIKGSISTEDSSTGYKVTIDDGEMLYYINSTLVGVISSSHQASYGTSNFYNMLYLEGKYATHLRGPGSSYSNYIEMRNNIMEIRTYTLDLYVNNEIKINSISTKTGTIWTSGINWITVDNGFITNWG